MCPRGHTFQWAEPGKEVAEAALLLGGAWRFVLTAPGLEAAALEGRLATRRSGRAGHVQRAGGWELALHTGRGDVTQAHKQGVPAAGRRLPWPQTWLSLHKAVWSPPRRARLTNTRAEAEPQNRPFPRGTGQSPGGQVDIVSPLLWGGPGPGAFGVIWAQHAFSGLDLGGDAGMGVGTGPPVLRLPLSGEHRGDCAGGSHSLLKPCPSSPSSVTAGSLPLSPPPDRKSVV